MFSLCPPDPCIFLCRAAAHTVGPQPAVVHGVVPSKMQDLAFGPVELSEIPVSPCLHPVQAGEEWFLFQSAVHKRMREIFAYLLLSCRKFERDLEDINKG